MASGSSYAERLARQWEQQSGRPADPNDEEYKAWIPGALKAMIDADHQALARSQGRWRMADRVATGATLGLLGAGVGSALAGGGGAAGASGSASVPGAVGAAEAPLGAGSVVASGALPSGVGSAVGAGGAATGAAGAAGIGGTAKGLLGGLSARDLAALGLTGASVIGSITSPKPNLNPTTMTTDPNFLKLIQSMQGRLDKSEPLYDSILSMANGLLPTQYQKGGGGMG